MFIANCKIIVYLLFPDFFFVLLLFNFPSLQKYLEKCTKCDKVIENETVRPKGSGKPYHTDCFCCVKCEQPLQGKYFTNETGMICENCFAVSIYKNILNRARS